MAALQEGRRIEDHGQKCKDTGPHIVVVAVFVQVKGQRALNDIGKRVNEKTRKDWGKDCILNQAIALGDSGFRGTFLEGGWGTHDVVFYFRWCM